MSYRTSLPLHPTEDDKPKRRTKKSKPFDTKISAAAATKEGETRPYFYGEKDKSVGSLGGRKKGIKTIKTKPGTIKTKTTTKFGTHFKGIGSTEWREGDTQKPTPHHPTVKSPKGEKQHWHDVDKRVTKTKRKVKKKGTKVVTDAYNKLGVRRRKKTWE